MANAAARYIANRYTSGKDFNVMISSLENKFDYLLARSFGEVLATRRLNGDLLQPVFLFHVEARYKRNNLNPLWVCRLRMSGRIAAIACALRREFR